MSSLRAMAIVRWCLLAAVTLLAAYSTWTYWGPEHDAHTEHGAYRYYCPMHPQIRSPDPGECPICHMQLEPIPTERRGTARRPRAPEATGQPDAAMPPDVVPVTLTAEKQRLGGVTTIAATNEAGGARLRVPGVVTAPESGRAEVRFRAPGFVERVAVRETGVRVARGQTLAWVYSPEVYRAEEELLAAMRWRTTSTANPADDIAPAARRALELLGLAASDIEAIIRSGQPMRAVPVRAPIAGYVTRFDAVLGSRADPETALYEIADLGTVWIVASVHERDLAHVRAGTSATFTMQAAPSPIHARVELVEPALDPDSRTARVRLVVANRDRTLRPGQFGDVAFDLPVAAGLFVPRDAIVRTGARDYVYVKLGEDRFEPRIVTTGAEVDERVQILEGVREGEVIVSRGTFMLDSESRLLANVPADAER